MRRRVSFGFALSRPRKINMDLLKYQVHQNLQKMREYFVRRPVEDLVFVSLEYDADSTAG